MDYQHFFSQALDGLKQNHNYRRFFDLARHTARFPRAIIEDECGRREVTIWCSNDYLAMGQHPAVIEAMREATARDGAGAGGSRNVGGTSERHAALEQAVADLHGREAGLLFATGYIANETALRLLGDRLPDCVFFSDELNHASLIHGMRAAKAERHVFKHSDVADLEVKLASVEATRPKIIVFESIYSMDGDIAPVAEICALAEKYNALTFLDEVHAVGIYGQTGAGIAERDGVKTKPTIIAGTLGKGYGVSGGYLAGSHEIIDFIRSFGPGFIFTTALPPAVTAGALASVEHLKQSQVERVKLFILVDQLRRQLEAAGFPLLNTNSHIIPVMINDAALCRQVSHELLTRHNILTPPINFPTVPVGTERLRLTLTPRHNQQMIDDFVTALNEVWIRLSLSLQAPAVQKIAA